MSFINTIEDDSDQVELIVRQRLEAKPGCNIVGFDAYDQTGAVTELSTQLSSNSSRIDGIIASLSDTDANVIALNSNLLTAIANTASNTVTNASLVSGLRADVDSNSALTSNLQANTVAIAADLVSNSALVSGLRTDLDANATLLSNTTARITVVEQNTSNLSNLTNTVNEHTTDILTLEQSVNFLDSMAGALDGNSSARQALLATGVNWGVTLFNFLDKRASKVRVGNVESVLETQFGDDLANLTSGNTASDVSADISTLKDVVNLELWGNLLGTDVVLSSPSNIGAPLTSNIILFNDALFGTSNTSVCQKLKSNVSNLQAFQSNTTNLLSNIQSELFTHDTLLALHSNDLADNVVTISNLSTSLADNSSRISNLEAANTGTAVWTTTSGNDIYYNSGDVAIGLTGAESKLHIYGSDNPLMLQSQRSPYPKLSYDFSGSNAENFQFYDHHGSGRGFLYGRKYTTGTTPNSNAGWHFYGNDTTLALRIDGSSKVGVGTTSPDEKLDVRNGSGNDMVSFQATSSGFSTKRWSGTYGATVGNPEIRTDFGMRRPRLMMYNSSGSNTVFISGDSADHTYFNAGRVGVGTSQPACPLHVNATTSTSVGETHRWVQIASFSGQNTNDPYDRKFGYTVSNTQGGNYDYSIKASGAVGSTRFIIKSDERIKKDIVDVSDDEALVKLRMLHPKKYRYIDESARGDQQVYGYLANEVQEVLPDAIVEHPEEVPSIYQLANVSNSSIITFSDFDTSKLQSNTLVAIGIDQLRHKLTVDEIIDSTSVRVAEDLSAVSGSLDEHGNVLTETQTLSITPEEYDELEDKTGFEPVSDDSNVITEYTKTTTTYVGDQLFVYGEVVDDFKHLQESAISTLSTAALQEVDRIQQQHDAQIADLETAVTSRDQQIDELRSELSGIVSRLESLEP